MYVISGTIATTGKAQRVVPLGTVVDNANTMFQSIVPQNTGATAFTLGDASVTTLNGLLLQPSGSVGSLLALNYPGDLKDFYVYGTSGGTFSIMVLQ